MRILVVGNGGREHALCWKLSQTEGVEIFAAPGNAGIAEVADCVPIGVADVVELADFASKVGIDLTVVGPELPLTLGIVDEFHKRDLNIFGPTRLASEIEGSKAFAKELMQKYDVPTAKFDSCSSLEEAEDALSSYSYPVVLKVDGLAGGKGVLIAKEKSEAKDYLREVFEDRRFGVAGDTVIIEEFLEGEEVSFMAITDGKKILPLAATKDYKQALDGDEGPNTGGMGAHSPAIILSGDTAKKIMKSIMIPVVQGLASEGRRYTGCLYAGVILTADGPKVLEFNCRFGDPETQVQMIRLESDLADVLMKAARGRLGDTKLEWKKEAAAGIVVAAEGYPGPVDKGREITIDPIDDDRMIIFHAATEKQDGKLVNVAGRVVTACGHGSSMTEALDVAYKAAEKVHLEGARYRKDIGYRALEQRQQAREA